MNSERSQEQLGEENIQSLLRNYYVPVEIREHFERSLFVELEQEYQRLHIEPSRKVTLASIFGPPRTRIIAVSASLALISGLAAVIILLTPRNVLAQTARALESVKTYHYEMRMPAMPSQGVREMWVRGNKGYCRRLLRIKMLYLLDNLG